MDTLQKTLDKFGKRVIKGAKRKVPSTSGKLKKSLRYHAKASKKETSFEFSISMEDYGEFIDRGVKGVGGKKADGTQWKKKKVINSPFKYKNKRPPSRVFSKWSIQKGIAPRTKGGKFANRKGLQFALAESVFRTGLKTTHFLTDPFNKEFKKLPNQLRESYGLVAEKFIGDSIDKINK